MKIGFFGKIATEFGGIADLDCPEAGLSVAALRRHLSETFQTDSILEPAVRAAVNDEIVADAHTVLPGDRVEFLSPVSGG